MPSPFPSVGASAPAWTATLKTYIDAKVPVLHATDYGLVGDDATANSLTALNAALNSASAPSVVYWAPGIYRLSAAITPVSYVTHVGAATMGTDSVSNPRSVLKWTSGSMIAPTGTTLLQGLTFENLALIANGGHLIDLTGTTGGMTFARFRRCYIKLGVTTSSLVKSASTTANQYEWKFDGCKAERLATHTVPAFDISAGGGTSHIKFEGGWWHSFGCSSTPFFRADYTGSGAGMYGFEFVDLIGEQNAGGLIHLAGIKSARIDNVTDTDQSALGASYADDVFKIAVGSGAAAASSVYVDRSGVTDGTMTAGKFHLNISSGSGHQVGRILNGTSEALVSVPINGRIQRHNGGWARSLRTTGSNYVVTQADDVIMTTAGAITVTLPDPTALLGSGTMPYGRFFTVKNRAGTAVTVASAGTATIDGSATLAVASQAKSGFITDGTNWFTL